ncbi:hypothetical protein ACJJTC_012360 [Scirpophaga incertulas]
MYAREFLVVVFGILTCVKSDCNVVSKSQWGGLEPVSVSYLPRPVDLVIIQHTVSSFCKTDAKCKTQAQNLQSYFMDQLHYSDMGSSFLVGGNGKIYEGAGWLHEGAHTYGYNKRSIGISFMGNFNNDTPTEAMLQAVKDLLKCGVDNGHLTADYHLVGHKQLIATESPGSKLYAKIRSWPHYLEDASILKK